MTANNGGKMTQSATKVHVISVTPLQQVTLRITLNEYFRKQCEELLATAGIGGGKAVDPTIGRFDTLFACYQACSAGLPSPVSAKYARTKMLFLGPTAMKYMTEAVNMFSIEDGTLDAEYREAISNALPTLRSLINTSAGHEYTMDEIKAAGLQ
jgi:hypothetical protein